MFGKTIGIPRVEIMAPIGISYFVLIAIGYLTDVYWGKFEAEKNFFKFTLFVGYFPQLSSGPFVKYDEMKEQLFAIKEINYEFVVLGIERILWGFFKKLVISQRLAVFVNTVYGNYLNYNGWYIILAAVAFMLQLYTDFSGGMDIIIGVSNCFGVTLPENFNLPFCATSIEEFWRRWHITLGAWLREYIFYPLLRSNWFREIKKKCKQKIGKNYQKKFDFPLYLAMFITWFLIGFWHGGKWNYIWGSGIYYWLLIFISSLIAPVSKVVIQKLNINTTCFSWKFFQCGRTMLLFSFGLSFFRAESLQKGIDLWKSAFSRNNVEIFYDGSLYMLGLDKVEWQIIFWSILVLLLSGCIKIISGKEIWQWLNEQNRIFRWMLLFILSFSVIIFGYYGPGVSAAEFIYQQF